MDETTEQTTMTDSSLGRRRAPREALSRTHCVTLEFADGLVIGALLDYTSDGLGLETNEPLAVGQQVTIAGNVEVDGVWKKIHGKARVIHCGLKGEACFRMGVAGHDWQWRSTIDPNSPILQRPARYSSG